MAHSETEQILAQFRVVFRRRKLLIGGCVLAIVAAITVHNETTAPLYEATTALVFDEFTGPVPSFHSDYTQEINTSNRIQELSSRSFAGQIVSLLTPEQRARFGVPQEQGPDFDETEWLTDRVHRSLTATAVRKSSLVRISARLGDPELCADVANTAAHAYQDRSLAVQQDGVRSIRLFIEEQLERFRGQLDRTEQSLRKYKEAERISSFEGQEQEVLRRLTEAEILYNSSTTERQGLENRLRTIEENLAQTRADLVPSVTEVASPRMQRLQESLLELQLQHSQLQVQGYATDHPKMRELTGRIAETKAALTQEAQRVAAGGDLVNPIDRLAKYGDERLSLQIEIAAVSAREEALQRVMADYERTMSRLPEKELRLAQLTRERDVNRRIYDNLLEKLEETKISEAENLPSVRIVDVAVPDPRPIRPRKLANLAIGVLLGVIAGTGLAFVRESAAASLDSVKELEAMTGWSALATLPRIQYLPPGPLPGDDPDGDPARRRARKRSLIALLEPGGGPAEAHRMLRTNLKFRGVGEGVRTLLVTSSEPNEGKTTLVSNLAISFATMGDRVLVVDAEVRRPGMHVIFNVPERPGLMDLLAVRGSRARTGAEAARVGAVIHRSEVPNLSVLAAGTPVDNPTDTLAAHAAAVRDILSEVRGDYDVIVMDTPPLALVHDTAILSQIVDGVIFVVNSRRIDRELLDRSRGVLERAGARVLGAVLNQVDAVGVYRKNSYYYRTGHRRGA